MATKSILKNVTISNDKLCRAFANALEHSSEIAKPIYDIDRKHTEYEKEKIKDFFG